MRWLLPSLLLVISSLRLQLTRIASFRGLHLRKPLRGRRIVNEAELVAL